MNDEHAELLAARAALGEIAQRARDALACLRYWDCPGAERLVNQIAELTDAFAKPAAPPAAGERSADALADDALADDSLDWQAWLAGRQ